MERKAFIKNCGMACAGSVLLGGLLESCSAKMAPATIVGSDLVLPASAFLTKGGTYKSYLVVSNDQLKFPICLYRLSADNYSAVLMRCTHQGAELQVFGDRLQCPAHGSEFTDMGVVKTGPATTNLRTFPVTIQNNQINISLK